MGNIFHVVLMTPIINILLFFNYLFSLIHIPGAFGFAVISLTAFIRLIFNPFYTKQTNTARAMEELKPELAKLSIKYKNDKQQLQKEQLKLYQERGINPASGCLLALIQIPIFIALYQVLTMFLQNGMKSVIVDVNKLAYMSFVKVSAINTQFFFYDLRISPSHFKDHGLHYLIIPAITAFLQYYQTKLQAPATNVTVKADLKKGEKPQEENMQQMMQTQMKIMFPIMIGYFSYILPVGLALYWNIFSLISIAQLQLPIWKKKKQ